MKNKLSNMARALALALVVVFTLSVFDIPVLAGTMDFSVTIQHDQTNAREMLDLVNALRIRNGIDVQLTYDYTLEQIAIRRAEEMGTSYSDEVALRPDGSAFHTLEIDGVSSECELRSHGYASTYSAYAFWEEEGDKTQYQRAALIDSEYVACGIAHVIFNGEHYWIMEMSSVLSNPNYVAPDDSITYSSISMDIDSSVFSATAVKNGTGPYSTYTINEEYDLPQVVLKCRREDSAGNSFVVDPSQYTVSNWRCSTGLVVFENGKMKAVKKGSGQSVEFDWSCAGKTGTGSFLIQVNGASVNPTITPEPTPPVDGFQDLTTEADRNITISRGDTAALKFKYSLGEGDEVFYAGWTYGLETTDVDEDVLDETEYVYTFSPDKSCQVNFQIVYYDAFRDTYPELNVTYNVTVVDNVHKLIDNTPDSEKNRCVAGGSTVTLNTNCTGDGNLSYSWFVKTGNIFTSIGGNSSSKTVTVNGSRTYRCVVSDTYGNSINVDFVITVSNISIGSNETNIKIGQGDEFTLTTNASSNVGSTLHYAWYDSNNKSIGSDTSTYSGTAESNTSYKCVITDGNGNSVTINYLIVVCTLTVPSDTTVEIYSGETPELTVYAESDSGIPLTYKWYKDGNFNIIYSQSSTYKPANVTTDTDFTCVVYNGYSTKSVTFSVKVIESTFVDNTSDDDKYQTVAKNTPLNLTVDVTSNTGDVTYQWQIKSGSNYSNISGEKAKSYQTTVTGSTSYRCVVSDRLGHTHNVDFEITVPTLTLGDNITTLNVGKGQTFTLTANASNSVSGDIHYHWTNSVETADYGSAQTYTTSVNSTTRYKCIVSDDFGNSETIEYTVKVSALDVKQNAENVSIYEGGSAYLSVTATTNSGNNITYKWFVESEPNNILNYSSTYSPAPKSDTRYGCTVSDTLNEVTVYFNVTVKSAALINSTLNTNQTVNYNSTVVLKPSVTSPAGRNLNYQWQIKGTDNVYRDVGYGGTSSSYSYVATKTQEYRCIVDDNMGNAVNVDYVITVPTLTAGENTTTDIIGVGGQFSFTANAISSNDSPLTYAWKNGNSTVGTAKTFSSTADQSTTYTCEVADEYNNKITITYTVTVHTLTASQSAASLS
ncbi:MAG: hypothetical protein J6U23_01540, partial [Clostridiales bacterium]|nr:hypothetical protein [Clostridiales bacterium]